GNLADLSPRARDLLAAAFLIASEDTRTTTRLLAKAEKRPRLISLTEHNTEERIPSLLETAEHSIVALVSEAGMPSIADPGARVVAAAHRAGVPVFVVPGPSALAAAIAASGFDGSDVHFLGFLPKKRPARVGRLR